VVPSPLLMWGHIWYKKYGPPNSTKVKIHLSTAIPKRKPIRWPVTNYFAWLVPGWQPTVPIQSLIYLPILNYTNRRDNHRGHKEDSVRQLCASASTSILLST
jgi:hypothetical protein